MRTIATVLAMLAVVACLVGSEPTIELDENGEPTEASVVAVADSAAVTQSAASAMLGGDPASRAFYAGLEARRDGVDIDGFTASELIEEGERREEGKRRARLEAEKSSRRGIAQALGLYKLDNRHYPTTEQGLEALVTKPSGFPEAKNWGPEPYLRKYPLDQYENDYFYLSEGRGFELKALGVEGGEGAAADVDYADIFVC